MARPNQYFPVVTALLGGMICYYSGNILTGLEILWGIEAIVGSEWVLYLPEGGYIYTNPMASVAWLLRINLMGIALMIGALLFGLSLTRSRGRASADSFRMPGPIPKPDYIGILLDMMMDLIFILLIGVMIAAMIWLVALPESAVATARILAALS